MIRGRRRYGLISDQEISGFRNGLVHTLQLSIEMFWLDLRILDYLIGLWTRQFVPLMTDRLHWKMDDPLEAVNSAIDLHKKMIEMCS